MKNSESNTAVAQQDGQTPPLQQSLPLAFVAGEAVFDKPEDLYIPPDAMEVILEAFEGPLDLLLYLIRKQKLNIIDLPIHQITEQYMEYVEWMKDVKLELAGEYLVMAALLAEIKSRMLLPKRVDDDGEEVDPRAELVRRLQEYETIRRAAETINEMPRLERDIHLASVDVPEDCKPVIILPDVDMRDLAAAFQSLMKRAAAFEHHHISREALSTRERMSAILERMKQQEFCGFATLFDVSEGKAGVVVTFLAILELVKLSMLELVQSMPMAEIHVRLAPEKEQE